MRIVEIKVRNTPPVSRFDVHGLSDLVVVAGPNGVGKTRVITQLLNHLQNATPNESAVLRIEATCREEKEAWGGDVISTDNAQGAQHLNQTLQTNRYRRNWRSSVLNFESNRTIQKLQAFKWSWDIGDPYEESIRWNTSFQPMSNRYQDTVHSIFRRIEHQKRQIANRAVQLQKEGKRTMNLSFKDPIAAFREAFSVMLAPKVLADPDPKKHDLEFVLNDQTLPFSALSSGEREATNIVFDFILRKPCDCIVFFDEPELHLHPELSYRLISTLRRFGERNQFILCTHSPDIISSSLEQSVVFLSPKGAEEEGGEPANQAVLVSEASEENTALRLLGHSIGIISLGKKIVLIEGTSASLDKQVYGSILENRFPEMVLVPCGGKATLESFDVITNQVLSKTLWGVEFFMLCDRDVMPFGQERVSDRLQPLKRYHLENYFLDEEVWVAAFAELESTGSWLRSEAAVRAELKRIAESCLSYATALYVAASVRRAVGNVDVMPKDCHNKSAEELGTLFGSISKSELQRANQHLDGAAVRDAAAKYYARLEDSLKRDTDEWKVLMPGKQILGRFASKTQLSADRAKRLYITAAAKAVTNPFSEVIALFEKFSSYPHQTNDPQ